MIDVTKMPNVLYGDNKVNWIEFSVWAMRNDPFFRQASEAACNVTSDDLAQTQIVLMIYVRYVAKLEKLAVDEFPKMLMKHMNSKESNDN